MSQLINRAELLPGMIVHVKTTAFFGHTIIKVLNSWGSHDAPVCETTEGYKIGDAEPWTAKLHSIEYYEQRMNEDGWEVQFLLPWDYTPAEGRRASDWWIRHVYGTFYDFAAFPRLLFKALFADIWTKTAGWEWANWCTEGVANAWKVGAGKYYWKKMNPTPRTTEKRLAEGIFVDVSDLVLGETDDDS